MDERERINQSLLLDQTAEYKCKKCERILTTEENLSKFMKMCRVCIAYDNERTIHWNRWTFKLKKFKHLNIPAERPEFKTMEEWKKEQLNAYKLKQREKNDYRELIKAIKLDLNQ
jgi:hypothetical protein